MALSGLKLRFWDCCEPGTGPARPAIAVKLTAALAARRPPSSKVFFIDVGSGGDLLQVCLRADLCGVARVRDLPALRGGLRLGQVLCVVGYLGRVAASGRDGGLTVFATRVWPVADGDGGAEFVACPTVEMLDADDVAEQVQSARAGSVFDLEYRRSTSQQYVALRVAYRGAWKARSGWQRQGAELESVLPSVQGALEGALSSVLRGARAPIVQAASRTDRGVHAHDQVAVARLPEGVRVRFPESESGRGPADAVGHEERTAGELVTALNSALPDGIAVLSCSPADARRLAIRAKEYWYYFQLAPPNAASRKPVPSWRVREAAPYAWFVSESLDVARMREALAHMVGTHDFRGLASDTSQKRPERTLLSASLEEAALTSESFFNLPGEDPPPWPAVAGPESVLLVVRLVGDGFLRRMVRRVAGTLKQVGTGQMAPEDVLEVLAGRLEGGPAAPARGLHLRRVLLAEPGPGESGPSLDDDE